MTTEPSYQHLWHDGSAVNLPLGKIVCIGRNYAEHARELNNPVPASPLLFIKPATAARPLSAPLRLPPDQGEVHFETEVAVLIGAPLTHATEARARDAIAGYGLALDLTLRELQTRLKEQGHPWERAKSFDGACPLSAFVPARELAGRDHLQFRLSIDGNIRQRGDTRDMIHALVPLLVHMSRSFTLRPGDVVLTGTPSGVGPLASGQNLCLELEDVLRVETRVE